MPPALSSETSALTDGRPRCRWPRLPLDVAYHDAEWGVPVHDDRALFELLVLEGAQAGLSWSTVLAKRPHYRRLFAGFDPAAVARFGAADVERLLGDAGIVRHRGKVAGAVTNARAFLAVQDAFGSFDAYVWRFVDGAPRVNRWRELREVPAVSPESTALSKDLRRRPDDLLRVHAGDGDGERPPGALLPARGADARHVTREAEVRRGPRPAPHPHLTRAAALQRPLALAEPPPPAHRAARARRVLAGEPQRVRRARVSASSVGWIPA